MASLVVFDCFGTLVTEQRPFPEPAELANRVASVLAVPEHSAMAVVDTVLTTLLGVFADVTASQPATRTLLTTTLNGLGIRADPAALDRVLWHTLGQVDDRFTLCRPAAEAMRRVAEGGHTVRLLSNCYLPGDLMRRLFDDLGVPDVLDRCVFTGDGGPKKPDPRAFALAGAGPFGLRVMVGDSPVNDIEPARALGWTAVQIDAADPRFDELHAVLDR